MEPHFRAVALDFDGTLTEDGVLETGVREALAAARAAGVRALLVTGRILDELLAVLPDAPELFDCVVAENGAVLVQSRMLPQPLAPPVDGRLVAELALEGVAFRRGDVLLAASATDAQRVLDAIARLGLDCQIVRNRSELMVLPAGVSKGSGLHTALGRLGVSSHSTIGVGDAENDLSLLNACELAVAVGNAVEAVRRAADVVTDRRAGEGVVELLRGPLLSGGRTVHSRRRRLALGVDHAGRPLQLPGSQLNVLITGSSHAGKSYVAGAIAEQAIEQGYGTLVVDPEGDHTGLGRLPGVLVVHVQRHAPEAEELVALLRHRFGSVVLDYSDVPRDRVAAHLDTVGPAIDELRRDTGSPHWIVVDEAQDLLGVNGIAAGMTLRAGRGHCLVTYRPLELAPEVVEALDAAVIVGDAAEGITDAARLLRLDVPAVRRHLAEQGDRRAVLLRREPLAVAAIERLVPRHTAHLRHWHKYTTSALPPEHRFHYRRDADTRWGTPARNIVDLHADLGTCDESVVAHHCRHNDFSRWIGDVIGDPVLADRVRRIEERANAGESRELARAALRSEIGARYLEDARGLQPAR